jgi:xanthosine utilization system XapX-like protein
MTFRLYVIVWAAGVFIGIIHSHSVVRSAVGIALGVLLILGMAVESRLAWTFAFVFKILTVCAVYVVSSSGNGFTASTTPFLAISGVFLLLTPSLRHYAGW